MSNYRTAVPGNDESSRFSDFIMSPLRDFDRGNLLSTRVEHVINQGTPIQDITIVGACTMEGWKYLATKMSTIIIYGFGEGSMGYGKSEQSFGTAGIMRGDEDYDWEDEEH
jgi:hypothetical protein